MVNVLEDGEIEEEDVRELGLSQVLEAKPTFRMNDLRLEPDGERGLHEGVSWWYYAFN